MAIHLPRQRNGFGIPARYTDLGSAGLLYTPPGAYRYDSYDIAGDVATLYAQAVDPADYQYNSDGFDAQVLPAGATAITGGNGMWKIEGGKLYFKMPIGDVWADTGWGTGFTGLAVFLKSNFIDGPSYHYCLAVQNGQLYWIWASPEAVYNRAPFTGATAWLTVSAAAFNDPSDGEEIAYIFGINTSGQLVLARISAVELQPRSLYQQGVLLGGYANWLISGPTYNTGSLEVEKIASALAVEKTSGILWELALSPAALEYLGTGWTAVTGYAMQTAITSAVPYDYSRMYGIKAGNLYSLRRDGASPTIWTATLIDDSGDWHQVQFISPDVAVALRRMASGAGGEIEPTGDIVISGTGTDLDGTYTLVSGTGESRLWRRDDGYNRYEIYYDSGYWVIHSSYDEMGTGEDYMMHFDECRGDGTDPWTATWETSWDDGVSGNQGTVPTVTGTEA